MDYKDWYEWNFKRTNGIIKSVERNLSQCFEASEKRAFDIWLDVPANTTNYIEQHMKKLDKQLKNLDQIKNQVEHHKNTIQNIDLVKNYDQEEKTIKFYE